MDKHHPILHTALLGTDKRPLRAEDLPDGLADAAGPLLQGTDGREEQFLKVAALAKNYRQCGVLPVPGTTAEIAPAPAEKKGYAPQEAEAVLWDILNEGSLPLLGFWMEACAAKNLIVSPGLVPRLLEEARSLKSLRPGAKACTGRRGAWLAGFNEGWSFAGDPPPDEEVWQTGDAEARAEVLKKVWAADGATGRAWLLAAWPGEAVNTRAAFLARIEDLVGAEDLPWLEPLLQEKSAKIKEKALALLKGIPGSSIVRQYEAVLRQAVRPEKVATFPGLHRETVLKIALPPVDDRLFETGIQKVSSEKGADDALFVVRQLAESVPPFFWEQHLEADKPTILKLFAATQRQEELVSALGKAAIRFRDRDWMRAVLDFRKNLFFADALSLLEREERDRYPLSFLGDEKVAGTVIYYITRHHRESWSTELTKAIFRFTAGNQYAYNRTFYNDNIAAIPAAIIPELEKCAPQDPGSQGAWNGITEYLVRLLTLKQQTLKAFQP